MSNFKWFLIGFMLMVQSSCTFNHAVSKTHDWLSDLQLISSPNVTGGRDWVVQRSSHWMVAVPSAGPDMQTDALLARGLASALRQEFAAVTLTAGRVDVKDALISARQQGANFMVYPKLIYQGDGAYSIEEWQMDDVDQAFGRDRLAVQLLVYDVNSNKLVDSVGIEAQESWLPGINDYPRALFEKAFAEFAQNYVYQRSEIPR